MSRADKLLARMRQSAAGWTARELDALYLGFGFERDEGKRHTFYIHPSYSQVRATVTRSSGEIATGYARTAVQLIDELHRLEEEARNDTDVAGA